MVPGVLRQVSPCLKARPGARPHLAFHAFRDFQDQAGRHQRAFARQDQQRPVVAAPRRADPCRPRPSFHRRARQARAMRQANETDGGGGRDFSGGFHGGDPMGRPVTKVNPVTGGVFSATVLCAFGHACREAATPPHGRSIWPVSRGPIYLLLAIPSQSGRRVPHHACAQAGAIGTMCRWAAYIGEEVFLEDIVTARSFADRPEPLRARGQVADQWRRFRHRRHADRPEPGLYRDILPAWSDPNLRSLCRQIKSDLFLAHVRASTGGATSRMNCHPFVSGHWSFMHNGQIGGFEQIRRVLENRFPTPSSISAKAPPISSFFSC